MLPCLLPFLAARAYPMMLRPQNQLTHMPALPLATAVFIASMHAVVWHAVDQALVRAEVDPAGHAMVHLPTAPGEGLPLVSPHGNPPVCGCCECHH
jgi:hypothetical protein